MTGPVFQLEWIRACTRGRHHRLRLIYWGVLTAEAGIFLLLFTTRSLTASPLAAREIAYRFLQILALQHFVLLFLLPPAFAAGAIADEKTRGSLTLLLATPLPPHAIIAGKWLSQVAQMLVLALPIAPLICFAAFVSGAPNVWLASGAAGTVLTIATMSAAGLLASVLCRRTATAVLACYVLLGLLLAGAELLDGWNVWHWRQHLSWEVLFSDESTYGQIVALLASYFGFALACLGLASWQLRPAHQRYLSTRPAPTTGWLWWRRPPVSEQQPLRWKERFVGELGYLRLLRAVPHQQRKIATFVAAALSSAALAWAGVEWFLLQAVGFLVIVSLTVAVRASGVISGERERQTWDNILAAPLSAYQIIRGKLWGIIDSARPYLMGYLAPALVVALYFGPLAALWTLYWWLATYWIVLYFLGAVGIQASASASGSWQGLLKTVANAGLLLIQRAFFLLVPLIVCVSPMSFVWMFGVGAASWGLLLTTMLVMTFFLAVLFAKTEAVLQAAEQVIENERIPDNLLMTIKQFATAGAGKA